MIRTILALAAVLPASPLLAQSKIPLEERTLGAEIPRAVERLAMEPDELPRSIAAVGGKAVEIVYDRSRSPFALLAEENHAALARDVPTARAWAESAKELLGLDGFELVPAGSFLNPEGSTSEFALVRDGLRVHASAMRLHWEGERFVAATVHAPRQLAVVDPVPAPDGVERVYVPYDRANGTTDLVLATVERDWSADRLVTTYTPRGRAPFRVITFTPFSRRVPAPPTSSASGSSTPVPPQTEGTIQRFDGFETFVIPSGTFPDQIDLGPGGNPWFSQPSQDRIVRLRKRTSTWDIVPIPGNSVPDGLVVDTNGEVWTGLFDMMQLARYTPSTAQLRTYGAPVSISNMAVPSMRANGNVLVTDHGGWLLEFEPTTEQWVAWDRTTSSAPHLVVASEDPTSDQIGMTQYTRRALGFRPGGGGSITDVTIPGSRNPAFLEPTGGVFYFTIWNRNEIGSYDPATGQYTFWTYPLGSGETGGPMDVAPNGDVVSGTRGSGYICVLRPQSSTMKVFDIPNPGPGLKDGLRCEGDNVVWFTESGRRNITRLRYLLD